MQGQAMDIATDTSSYTVIAVLLYSSSPRF